jgi:SAM-dependent methyltransferase
MVRFCEVCKSNTFEDLRTVRFVVPNLNTRLKYTVVTCKNCGFVFANDIPSQKEMDDYYKSSIKYTYSNNIPSGLKDLYGHYCKSIDNYLRELHPRNEKEKISILDIGCGPGLMLYTLKNNGYTLCQGLEPSPDCVAIAQKEYGLTVTQGTVSTFTITEKFDCIILSGVFEHIQDLNGVINGITRLLKDESVLIIIVPDAEFFSLEPKAPLDEFSIEHINFFTNNSLVNLLNNYHFKIQKSEHLPAPFYDSTSLLCFFKKQSLDPNQAEFQKDESGKEVVSRYIEASNKCLDKVNHVLSELSTSESIAVWGAGSLTYRLLAETKLSEMKIDFFIDKNQNHWEKKLNGIPIISPDQARRKMPDTILIGSSIYFQEIKSMLEKKFEYKGKILGIW